MTKISSENLSEVEKTFADLNLVVDSIYGARLLEKVGADINREIGLFLNQRPGCRSTV